MNGEQLAELHEDVKAMLISIGILTTKIDIYIEDTKDHEERIRRLERGEKAIWGIGTILAALITWGEDIRAWINKIW